MKTPIATTLIEARNVLKALQGERKVASVAPVVVSGVLAEQLAKELSAGAAPGSVTVADDPGGTRSPVAIRVIAGHPSAEDDAFVRRAERLETPVVIVQLWPQEPWREPYVLSPFVVECKAGEGFPLSAIARLVAIAADDAVSLAGRIPVLAAPVESMSKRDALVRSAILAGAARGKTAVRPVLALEQVSLIARLRALEDPETRKEAQMPVLAGTAAAALAASYGFRKIARVAGRRLPRRPTDAAIAVAGTWLLAEVSRRLEARGLI